MRNDVSVEQKQETSVLTPITFDANSFIIGADGSAKYNDVSVFFQNENQFLYNIAIMGEKGSGKTTLIEYLISVRTNKQL